MHFFIDQIAFKSELRGPAFKCETKPDGSLRFWLSFYRSQISDFRLHYYSLRKGLFPLVKGMGLHFLGSCKTSLGLVRQSAKALFGLDIKTTVTERTQERRNNLLSEHVVFSVEAEDESEGPLVKASPSQKMAGLGDPLKVCYFSCTLFISIF